MSVHITIIGLGQMGGSIGLALADHTPQVVRLGHDREPEVARLAQKMGAVDRISYNLPAAVEQADVVVLAVPLNQVRDTLTHICADLKEGAVVIDTSPAKRQVESWAMELLPAGRYYLGLAATLRPACWQHIGGGLQAARADLFHEATFLLCLPPGAPSEVADLGVNFAHMLGARPLFSEALEADGILAAMSTLPHLLAVSLMNATVNQPGWQDARHLAGRSYGVIAMAAFDRDDADALCEAALLNHENVVRVLDRYLASLTDLRQRIEEQDRQGLSQRIHWAYEQAHRWLAEQRLPAPQPTDDSLPSSPQASGLGQHLRQMFLGRLFERPSERP